MGLSDRRFRDELSSLLINLLRSSCCFRSKDTGRGKVLEPDLVIWVASGPPLLLLPHGQPDKHFERWQSQSMLGWEKGVASKQTSFSHDH